MLVCSDLIHIQITDMMKQGLELSNNPHIVIATPGRLADHLRSTDTVSFQRLRFLVGLGGWSSVALQSGEKVFLVL